MFLNPAGSDAASADPDPLARPFDERLDCLKVRGEKPLGFIVGMADVKSNDMPLSADLAYSGHDENLLYFESKMRSHVRFSVQVCCSKILIMIT